MLGENLHAQKLRVGITARAVAPLLSSSNYPINKNVNPGYGLGMKGEFNFHRHLGISLGIEYSRWGIEFDGRFLEYPDHTTPAGNLYHHKIRANEILVPLLIKIDSDSLLGNKLFYGYVGYLAQSVLKSSTEITFNTNGELLYEGEADLRYYGWDAITSGIGMEFKFSGMSNIFFGEFNVNYNFSPFLYHGKPDFASNDMSIKVSSLSLGFGAYF
ncbi:MAG: outer membrane beta-barrel protein [Flavobacteriales bacterium]|nr:outer membrane beta-barrel protein [Flavobacteriales bacterium]